MSSIALLIKKNDINIFYLINRRMHCNPLNTIMKMITQMGSTGFSVGTAALLLAYGFIRPSKAGMLLTLNLIISQIIIQVVKRLVNRPRPYKALEWVISLKPTSCQYSLPSGHTSAAFSTAFVFAHVIPACSVIFMILASLVGISRVYLGCHYPTDVIIGFAVSSFISVILNIAVL